MAIAPPPSVGRWPLLSLITDDLNRISRENQATDRVPDVSDQPPGGHDRSSRVCFRGDAREDDPAGQGSLPVRFVQAGLFGQDHNTRGQWRYRTWRGRTPGHAGGGTG